MGNPVLPAILNFFSNSLQSLRVSAFVPAIDSPKSLGLTLCAKRQASGMAYTSGWRFLKEHLVAPCDKAGLFYWLRSSQLAAIWRLEMA